MLQDFGDLGTLNPKPVLLDLGDLREPQGGDGEILESPNHHPIWLLPKTQKKGFLGFLFKGLGFRGLGFKVNPRPDPR